MATNPESVQNMQEVPFNRIMTMTDEELIEYCLQGIGCYKKYSQADKLFPKSKAEFIDSLKFHNQVKGKDNILVIVQTQYQTLGLFTEEKVIEEANVSWEPKGPFYIFEFFREKEQKIPPTRYVNTANKAYIFTSDPR